MIKDDEYKMPKYLPTKEELESKGLNSATAKLLSGRSLEPIMIQSGDPEIHLAVKKLQSGVNDQKLTKREIHVLESIKIIRENAFAKGDSLIALENMHNKLAKEKEEAHKKLIKEKLLERKAMNSYTQYNPDELKSRNKDAENIYAEVYSSKLKVSTQEKKQKTENDFISDEIKEMYSITKGRHYKFTTKAAKEKEKKNKIKPKDLELNSASSIFFAERMGWIEPKTKRRDMSSPLTEYSTSENGELNNSVEAQLFQTSKTKSKISNISKRNFDNLNDSEEDIEIKKLNSENGLTLSEIEEIAKRMKERNKVILNNQKSAIKKQPNLKDIYSNIVGKSVFSKIDRKTTNEELEELTRTSSIDFSKVSELVLEENIKKTGGDDISKEKKNVKAKKSNKK